MAVRTRGVLVVVGVVEARGFPARQRQSLVVEGRLGSEALATDPVPLSGASLTLDTELGWQMSRKALQQHRMHRTPLKLQVYTLEHAANTRQTLGYTLLDLRAAQANSKPRWFSLLNCRYSNPRPELLLSLSVEEEVEEGGGEVGGSEASLPHTLTLTLDESGGHYVLGSLTPHSAIFTLSLTLHSPTNTPQPPSSLAPCYFYYSLLGNDITSEPFLSPSSFRPERASIRIKSSRDSLGLLLAAQDDLKVHLCSGDSALCHGSLPLSALASSNSLEHTLALDSGRTPAPSPVPSVCVSAAVDLEEAPPHFSTPSHPSTSTDPQPVAMTTTGPPPEKSHSPLSTITPPALTPSRHKTTNSDEKLLPSPGALSARRNLTHSFEEASGSHPSTPHHHSPPLVTKNSGNKSPLVAQDTAPHPTPSLSTAPQPTPSLSTAPHPTPTPPTAPPPSAGPPLATPSTALGTHLPAGHQPAPPSTHHFMLSIDLHSLHNSAPSPSPPLHLRYCYPFFGCPYPVLVQPPVSVEAGGKESFTQSYCAFDFATSEERLRMQLTAEPLSVEVWQSSGVSVLLASAEVPLSEVWKSEGVKVEGSMRRVCTLQVPITPSPHSSPSTLTGHLSVCIVLEDRGAVRLVGGGGGGGDKVKAVKAEDPALPSSSEYHAAVELELWRLGEEEQWRKEMKSREEAYMARLAGEWERRDKDRQLLLKQKLDHHAELERQLSEAVRDLQQQRLSLREKERELLQQQAQLTLQCQHVKAVEQEERRGVRDEYEQRLQIERLKVGELEAIVQSLGNQVATLEQRCRSQQTEFDHYREQAVSQPASRLQAELSIAQLEKSNLERKLSTALQSKQHYKAQWARALKELAAARQREQASAREHLLRQQQELEGMRERLVQQEEEQSLHQQLSSIRTEVDRLQERATSQQAPPSSLPHPSPPHPHTDSDGLDSNVARWVEERDILLQTGVYTSSDPTIQRLDAKIREALASRTSS